MKAQVLTPWAGKGDGDDPYRPLLADLYRVSWTDVTGQPSEKLSPDPNLYVIEIQCDEKVLAEIESDKQFLVLWSE